MVVKVEVKLDEKLLRMLDEWYPAHGYTTRSEAIRSFIRRAVLGE